jgi:hypothetical protein
MNPENSSWEKTEIAPAAEGIIAHCPHDGKDLIPYQAWEMRKGNEIITYAVLPTHDHYVPGGSYIILPGRRWCDHSGEVVEIAHRPI